MLDIYNADIILAMTAASNISEITTLNIDVHKTLVKKLFIC